MSLYDTILNKGGQVFPHYAFREFISKDGTKFVRQYATKRGDCAIDIYDKTSGHLIQTYKKAVKTDGQGFLSKIYNFANNKGKIHAAQKLEKQRSFMSTLFDISPQRSVLTNGKFISSAEGNIKEGAVRYFPVGNNSINTMSPKIQQEVSIFNKLYGKIDTTLNNLLG